VGAASPAACDRGKQGSGNRLGPTRGRHAQGRATRARNTCTKHLTPAAGGKDAPLHCATHTLAQGRPVRTGHAQGPRTDEQRSRAFADKEQGRARCTPMMPCWRSAGATTPARRRPAAGQRALFMSSIATRTPCVRAAAATRMTLRKLANHEPCQQAHVQAAHVHLHPHALHLITRRKAKPNHGARHRQTSGKARGMHSHQHHTMPCPETCSEHELPAARLLSPSASDNPNQLRAAPGARTKPAWCFQFA
jgi:hypothetical protein